ncbi:MAG: peptide chain release factor N(5)-glutamine methyltransferase [Chitinophagaceae bacterium]
MTWQEAQFEMRKALTSLYESREASRITEWIMEFISKKPRIERIMLSNNIMMPEEISVWEFSLQALMKGEPVQYVTGNTWFGGHSFEVDQHVLIPRPETEELVELIYNENKNRSQLYILDIGTGSGCIPVTLKLKMPSAFVSAIDVSANALTIAKKNASALHADVLFMQMDLFDTTSTLQLPEFDIIVSNPPYIPLSEKKDMDTHVVDHEPHLALFVQDNDPLIFYKTIAILAKQKLKDKGLLYFETHFKYANEVAHHLKENGFEANVLTDVFGKQRFVKALWHR